MLQFRAYNSSFSGNNYNNTSTSGSGGGIYFSGYGLFSLDNCVIQNNLSKYNGGGLYIEGTALIRFKNTLITDNQLSYIGNNTLTRRWGNITLMVLMIIVS